MLTAILQTVFFLHAGNLALGTTVQKRQNSLESKSCQKAGRCVLDEHCDHCADNIDHQERCSVTADEHNDAKYKAEPGTDSCAAGCRADDDGDQHQRDGEGTEFDKRTQKLQDYYQCSQDRSQDHRLC